MMSFAYSQLFVTPTLPSSDFAGQTIIITGSNTGLGLEAARQFVRLKASLVILAVRDIRKGEAAKENIVRTESSNREDVATCIQVWELDLASYDSVKAFARRVETLDRVDKVIENASIYPPKFDEGEGGDELSVVVNVISTFLLALLLLPKLRESATKTGTTPTLSVTGSFVHWFTKFPERNGKEGIFTTLADQSKANMVDRSVPSALAAFLLVIRPKLTDSCRYNVTKAMQLYLVRELASLISSSPKGPSVVLNISSPGYCRSSIFQSATGFMKTATSVLTVLFSRSTEAGGRTLVAGACGGSETHGQYLSDCKVGK
jgi:NAD(P)-dependent dehydrogenase (short-subunit alcohol dehydrogenase family)